VFAYTAWTVYLCKSNTEVKTHFRARLLPQNIQPNSHLIQQAALKIGF